MQKFAVFVCSTVYVYIYITVVDILYVIRSVPADCLLIQLQESLCMLRRQ